MPRPLTDEERALLLLLLSVDFPGVVALREQARTVEAEGGGMVVDLVVDEGAPLADVVSRTPVQADVDGAGYCGGLILFVDGGRLSALEYWWVTDEAPATMPPLKAVGQPLAAV